jgi:catechol 2,3-dioxygenase-like lactoylglutathione lyase family enzyme
VNPEAFKWQLSARCHTFRSPFATARRAPDGGPNFSTSPKSTGSQATGGETFDPRRTGFDHMGFKVDTRADLDEWLSRFERLGVSHSPIAEVGYGAVLTFKDPDGIQFEMFFKADHP